MFSDKAIAEQTDEKFSGSAIGIAEQTQMPGMGRATSIPSSTSCRCA